MKRNVIVLIGILGILFGFSSLGVAAPSYNFSFDDVIHDNNGSEIVHWPGYPAHDNSTGINQDEDFGTPEIQGGSGSVSNGFLTQLVINYNNPYTSSTAPDLGDLFIDVDSDLDWDYVVDLQTRNGYVPGAAPLTSGDILAFADGSFLYDDEANYIFSDDYWPGGDVRSNHPVGVNLNNFTEGTDYQNIGQANILGGTFVETGAGFGDDTVLSSIVFDLDLILGGINVGGSDWIAAGGASCANDVFYAPIKDPSQVPEPGTWALLGVGLTFALGYNIRRRRRS